jgi:low temperature requirement protein LtrA
MTSGAAIPRSDAEEHEHNHPSPVELSAELIEVTGGLRVARPPPRARVHPVPPSLPVVIADRPQVRHLRPRGGGVTQPTTTVELFFDLVYVFAITQLSHLILDDLSVGGVARAAFLLLIVWWAWIYTTWMANWFDPASSAVRAVLTGVMLASLLMAAALPSAFGAHGVLFAISYVVLQVGRNAAAASLLGRDQPLRDVFERLVGWSAASGVLWLAGAALPGDRRLLLWIPAVVLDLCAPVAGYWLPGRGRAVTTDYDIEGGHFADRCQGFIIIALGESIVVTGATAADAGLSSTVVLCLGVAFLETAALWWLYFGAVAERSRRLMSSCEDPGRLARDAYTYLHVPIVAAIIAVAVGDDLLIAEPGGALHGVGLAMVLGGPVLYLVAESLFRLRMTGAANTTRLAVAAILVLLIPLGPRISALALSGSVAALLSALALWESRTPTRDVWETGLDASAEAGGRSRTTS